jgi:hypothetical protein
VSVSCQKTDIAAYSMTSSARPSSSRGTVMPLGSHLIDEQFNFRDLLDRQDGGPFALEDPTGIDSGLSPRVLKVCSIAHQAAEPDGLGPPVDCWYRISGREVYDVIAVGE